MKKSKNNRKKITWVIKRFNSVLEKDFNRIVWYLPKGAKDLFEYFNRYYDINESFVIYKYERININHSMVESGTKTCFKPCLIKDISSLDKNCEILYVIRRND